MIEFDSTAQGISIPVVMRSNGHNVKLIAKLDTGAENCIFRRIYAEQLGFDVEEGEHRRFSTMREIFDAWGHNVSIEVSGLMTESMVYFADIPRDVLGRVGWIDRFKLGLIDYDRKLFIATYGC